MRETWREDRWRLRRERKQRKDESRSGGKERGEMREREIGQSYYMRPERVMVRVE